jgi:signal transduction histidine kinase
MAANKNITRRLTSQIGLKDITAAKLIKAHRELAFQNREKEKRAAELLIANRELAFQNREKEKRASELAVANEELAYQNEEKEKRAAELAVANKELAYQNKEKEKRAAELTIANKELAYQNEEKEKRAAELIVANTELAYQNEEKEKRATELIIANKELVFQNEEKEKRAEELLIANKELESFTFISSHDLQEPLRKIQAFSNRLLEEESENLSEKGKHYLERTKASALHMQTLINDLLAYSRTTVTKRTFESSDLNKIVNDVKASLKEELLRKQAVIEADKLSNACIIPFQFKQLMQNLISNSLKFAQPGRAPHIVIKSAFIKNNSDPSKNPIRVDCCHITVSDNGIGFNPEYKEKIFDIFKRLHDRKDIEGTGIGLTIVRKIVENHNGLIFANSEEGKRATFDIYIPFEQAVRTA